MWYKIAVSTAVVMVPWLFVWATWLAHAQPRPPAGGPKIRTEITCTLNQVERDDRRQRFATFRASACEVKELDNGYSLRFELDEPTFQEAASLILDESHCCAFFEFRLTVQPSRNSLWFEITGPKGAKEFLTANIGFDSSISKPLVTPLQAAGNPGCECQTQSRCPAAGCRIGPPRNQEGGEARQVMPGYARREKTDGFDQMPVRGHRRHGVLGGLQ